jgi:general secretion pathway protein L
MSITDALRSFRVPSLPGGFAVDELFGLWQETLVSCLPSPLRRAIERRDQRFVVVPDGDSAHFYQQQGSERSKLDQLDGGDLNPLKSLLPAKREGRPKVIVELPPEQVLSRAVSFPTQVRDNLSQVMRYEIDRISPFQADQVCFDFRVSEDAAPKDKILVDLVLCRRDRVGDWLRRLREAGAPAEQLTWQGAWPRANLLPPEERPRRRIRIFSLSRLLLLAVLLLLAAVLITPLWQQNRVLEALNANLGKAKEKAEEVQEMRGTLERAREGSVAALERKLDQPRMIDLLRELTDVLPDDTWVQNLDMRDGEVQVRGESAQATALIGLLEKAPGISGVSFRSPVVQVAATGQERFHISFNYIREAPE